MTEPKGKAWFKIDWDPQKGHLHAEGNVSVMEALALMQIENFGLLLQNYRGQGTGVLAETIQQGPALQVRRADHLD